MINPQDDEGRFKGVSNTRDQDRLSVLFLNETFNLKPEIAKERRCMKCSVVFLSIQRICVPCKQINRGFYVDESCSFGGG